VALEARAMGCSAASTSGITDKVYVLGTDMPSVRSTVAAKLRQDPSIDLVVTLGAPFGLTASRPPRKSGSQAKVATFDTNPQVPAAIRTGACSGPSTSSPICRATWRWTPSGSSRPTATSSAGVVRS
jgi:simple sugar transport system substrate-binding protein